LIPLCVRISGTGIVCALGNGTDAVLKAIEEGRSGLAPLTGFTVSHTPPLPVGESPDVSADPDLPKTFALARIASDQAMSGANQPPDAIVIGVTTGGMAETEALLKQGNVSPEAYRHHGIGCVAEDLAGRFQCKGPVLTISTACSSGGCAIAIAAAMIRSGRYRRVLTGGVDALCRLTYYGFKSLQLIDPQGSRPLDQDRRGMSVAEGAGLLLVEAADETYDGIEVMGAGLSCDAHHPTQPHPKGDGALSAMQQALSNAGLDAQQIDYINLHGTGTADNDRSESMAVNRLYENTPPMVSSIKGATGHCLAASGAIEAVITTIGLDTGLIPANTGCNTPDPDLNITPVKHPIREPIGMVLSNSFGFGGNNASVVIGRRPEQLKKAASSTGKIQHPLTAIGWAAITGAGRTDSTLENLSKGLGCRGRIDPQTLCKGIAPGVIRRVKRLSHMGLALLTDLQINEGTPAPKSVFFGTGWGSLSETNDFLNGLFESDEKFSSPTDFIGSVHNAAAGQIALMAQSTGANLTLSGGDYSFEQALFSAQMLVDGQDPVMVLGADETHEKLSPLFDPCVSADAMLSDGAGALMLCRVSNATGPTVALTYFANHFGSSPDLQELVTQLGGAEHIRASYSLIMVGLPAAQKNDSKKQLDQFIALSNYQGEVLDYRRLTGQYATSAAVATVFAVSKVATDGKAAPQAKGILILGLGSVITAIEVRSA
jgi:3-oxoacyl-[acyl-carrier-protein] synthase-1/3-oxoacyl-[acyl-carrier-protein] synthase II